MVLLQRLIKNEAMKVDPVEIYSWRVLFLACCACFGGLLFGMDTGIIGGVLKLPSFEAAFGLHPDTDPVPAANLSANIVTVMQAGAFVGALLAIPVADGFGRKPGLYMVSVFTVIGVIFQAAAGGQLAVLYVGRFIAGLGLGSATMITPTYVSENAPRAVRGVLTGMYQLFETTGAMLAFWIDFGCLLHISDDNNAQWIVPIAMQALPAVLLSVGVIFCNESPRFMAKKDKWEEATATLCLVRNLPAEHPYIQAELHEMQVQLEEERSLAEGRGFGALMREQWLVPANRKRILISIGLMVCQQMTGTNAVNYYAPTIFSALGVTGNAQSLFATGVYGICKVVGCSAFLIFLADSWGRKKSLMFSGASMGVAMFYLGFYVRFDPPQKNMPVPPAGYVALVMVYIFAICFQLGWGPVCWIYVSEIPSSRLRGFNVAVAAATQWLFNFVVARAAPVMLITVGGPTGYGTYFIFGSFCFAMVGVVLLFIPETKGISLERMDELFGSADFRDVEDIGVAAQHALDKNHDVQIETVSKDAT